MPRAMRKRSAKQNEMAIGTQRIRIRSQARWTYRPQSRIFPRPYAYDTIVSTAVFMPTITEYGKMFTIMLPRPIADS